MAKQLEWIGLNGKKIILLGDHRDGELGIDGADWYLDKMNGTEIGGKLPKKFTCFTNLRLILLVLLLWMKWGEVC